MDNAGLIPFPEPDSLRLANPKAPVSYRAYSPGAQTYKAYSPQLPSSSYSPYNPQITQDTPLPDLPYPPQPTPASHDSPYEAQTRLLMSDNVPSSNFTQFDRYVQHKKWKLVAASLVPTCAGVLEFLLLVYLLDVFLALPATPTGGRPRVSPVYSIWPYISCVGSTVLPAYKAFSFPAAFLFTGTFVVDVFLSRNLKTTLYLRYLRLFSACVASALLVALVFAAENNTTHKHLYLVSIHMASALLVKVLTGFIDRHMRLQFPALKKDTTAKIALRWRYVIFATATPIGILGSIGIYACRSWKDVQTPGTTCYRLVAIAAISDWAYAFISVGFLLSIAYDLYHAQHYQEIAEQSQAAARSTADRKLPYHFAYEQV